MKKKEKKHAAYTHSCPLPLEVSCSVLKYSFTMHYTLSFEKSWMLHSLLTDSRAHFHAFSIFLSLTSYLARSLSLLLSKCPPNQTQCYKIIIYLRIRFIPSHHTLHLQFCSSSFSSALFFSFFVHPCASSLLLLFFICFKVALVLYLQNNTSKFH